MTVLDKEPAAFNAGDSLSWRVELSDYLSTDGWALVYHFVKADARISVTATADPDVLGAHLVTIDSTTSATFATTAPVTWSYQAQVSKDGERHTVRTGTTRANPDFAAAAAASGIDTRTHEEKALEAIEAVIEDRASGIQASYTIDTPDGSRAVSLIPHDQLLKFRDKYRAEVKAQKKIARDRKYGPSKVLVRMGRL